MKDERNGPTAPSFQGFHRRSQRILSTKSLHLEAWLTPLAGGGLVEADGECPALFGVVALSVQRFLLPEPLLKMKTKSDEEMEAYTGT